jgi:hypothetical protein
MAGVHALPMFGRRDSSSVESGLQEARSAFLPSPVSNTPDQAAKTPAFLDTLATRVVRCSVYFL